MRGEKPTGMRQAKSDVIPFSILEKPLVRSSLDERKRLPARCRTNGSATLVCTQEFIALDLSLRADGS
jgi:hypothetical protein